MGEFGKQLAFTSHLETFTAITRSHGTSNSSASYFSLLTVSSMYFFGSSVPITGGVSDGAGREQLYGAVRCGLDCGLRFLVQHPVTY
jgi:hypothetical protein